MGAVEGMTPLLCAVFAEDVDLVRLLARTLAVHKGFSVETVGPRVSYGVRLVNCYTWKTSQPFLHIFWMYPMQLLS